MSSSNNKKLKKAVSSVANKVQATATTGKAKSGASSASSARVANGPGSTTTSRPVSSPVRTSTQKTTTQAPLTSSTDRFNRLTDEQVAMKSQDFNNYLNAQYGNRATTQDYFNALNKNALDKRIKSTAQEAVKAEREFDQSPEYNKAALDRYTQQNDILKQLAQAKATYDGRQANKAKQAEEYEFKSKTSPASYEGLMSMANSQYLSPDQRRWANEMAQQKATSTQATGRMKQLDDEMSQVDEQLNVGFNLNNPMEVMRYQSLMNQKKALQDEKSYYEGTQWKRVRDEDYGSLNATKEDASMVQGRQYNNQYRTVLGLADEEEVLWGRMNDPDNWQNTDVAYRGRDAMTDQEKYNYSYLYNKYGEEKANDYLEWLSYDLNERIQTEMTSQLDLALTNARNKNLIPDTGISVLDRLLENAAHANIESEAFVGRSAANLSSGFGYIDSAVQKFIDPERPMDTNRLSFTGYHAAQTISENQLSQIDSGVGRFLYQTASSMLDSAAVIGATALGIPGAVGLLGGAAATDSLIKAKERGATDSQALTVALFSGAAEMVFEELSLEKLFTTGAPGNLRELITNILTQGGTEGSEEFFTTIANTITDAIIMGDKSELKQKVSAYKQAGYSDSDAEKQAWLDWMGDLAMDAVGGFASGLAFGAGGQAVQGLNVQQSIKSIQSSNSAGNLVDNYYQGVSQLADENGVIPQENAGAYNAMREAYEQKMTEFSQRGTQFEETVRAIDQAVESGSMTAEEALSAKAFLEVNDDLNRIAEGEETVESKYLNEFKNAAETNEQVRENNETMLSEMANNSTALLSSPQSVMDNYDGSTTASDYFGAWRYYEQMGMQSQKTGDKFSQVRAADTRYANSISDSAAIVAFAAGATTQAATTQTVQVEKRGTGKFEASETALSALAQNVKDVDSAVSFLTQVAKKTGLTVKLDSRLGKNTNGKFAAATMSLALNPDSNIVTTVFHELGHDIEHFNPSEYSRLKSDILSWYAQSQGMNDVDGLLGKYQKAYKGYNRTQLETEMVNDAFGSLFNGTDAAKELAEWLNENKNEEERKGFIEKLKEFIDTVVGWLKNIINLDKVNPMQKRTVNMELKQAQAFRKAFLAAVDTATENARSGFYTVDINTATEFNSEDTAQSLIDYSLNVATMNYAEQYTVKDEDTKAKISTLRTTLESLWDIETELKTLEDKTSHSIHDMNKTLEAHPELHQRLWDLQQEAIKAGIPCDFVSKPGDAVYVEGKAVAPGLKGLPIEYVEAEEGSKKYVERTSDEYRHEGYKFTAFKRSIPQMFLDSVPVNAREPLRLALQSAVEDAYEKGAGSKIIDDINNVFPIVRGMTKEEKAAVREQRAEAKAELKALKKAAKDVATPQSISGVNSKTMKGVQAPLRSAEKTVMALNTNSACPMFTIGNHGCYLDACYLTQMANGATGTNLFRSAWYTGEILQMSDEAIETMNTLGGLRVNGVGDTTMDNASQLISVLKHAAMRGLSIKIITKQKTTFDMLAEAHRQGINLKNVQVQPSMDNLWIPATEDDIFGAGIRGNTGIAKTLRKISETTDPSKVEDLNTAASVAYDEVFGRYTRVVDGQLHRKYGFSPEQVNEWIERGKTEYPDVTITPRYVVCTPEEIAEVALNRNNILVNGGAVIQTLMHGAVPPECFSDYGTDILNFGGLRHVVEFNKDGTFKDFYGVTVKYLEEEDLDENGNKQYTKKGEVKMKKVLVDGKPTTVINRASSPNSAYAKVIDFVTGKLKDGTQRYTAHEQRIIWLTLKESMCCQANKFKDACAGCQSLCANGAMINSIQERHSNKLPMMQESDPTAGTDFTETKGESEDGVDLSLAVADYDDFADVIGDARGVNVKGRDWVEKLLSGAKTVETRETAKGKYNAQMRNLVGQRIGLVLTGEKDGAKLTGMADLVEEIHYETRAQFEADFARHQVPVDDPDYGWHEGREKWGYVISNATPLTNLEGRVELAVNREGNAITTRQLKPKQADLSRNVDDTATITPESARAMETQELYDTYMDAAKKKDLGACDILVREAATRAGYTTPKLFHGSRTFGFTVFNEKKGVPKNDMWANRFIYAPVLYDVAKNYTKDPGRKVLPKYIRKSVGAPLRSNSNAEDIAFNLNQLVDPYGADVEYYVLSESDKKRIAKKAMKEIDSLLERWDEANGDLDLDRRSLLPYFHDDTADAVWCINNIYSTLEDAQNARVLYMPDTNDVLEPWREMHKLVRNHSEDLRDSNLNGILGVIDSSQTAVALMSANAIAGLLDSDTADVIGVKGSDAIAIPQAFARSMVRQMQDHGVYSLYGDPGDNVLYVRPQDGKDWQHWPELRVPEMGPGKHSTDEVCDWAEKHGYTAVFFENIQDGGDWEVRADQYAFFQKSQVKSADPITYDDDGNIIPLEDRFKHDKNDIRESKMKDTKLTKAERKALEARVQEAERNAKAERERAEHFKSELKQTPQYTPDKKAIQSLAEEFAEKSIDDASSINKKLRELYWNANMANEKATAPAYEAGQNKDYAAIAMNIAKDIATDIVVNTMESAPVTVADRAFRDEVIEMKANAIIARVVETKLAKSTQADKWAAKLDKATKALAKTETYAMKGDNRYERLEAEYSEYRQNIRDKMAAMKARHDAEMAFQRQGYNEKIAEIRARKNEQIEAEKQHRRERVADIREQQRTKEIRKKVLERLETLRSMVDSPDAKKLNYVPDPIADAVTDYLASITAYSKRLATTGVPTKADAREAERLNRIQAIAEGSERAMQGGDVSVDYFLDLPFGTAEAIKELQAIVRREATYITADEQVVNVRTSDYERLALINEVTGTIIHAIKKMNRLYVAGRYQTVNEMAQDTHAFLSDVKKSARADGAVSRIINFDMQTPYYFFERFGEAGHQLFANLGMGLSQFAKNINTILDFEKDAFVADDVKSEVKNIKESHIRKEQRAWEKQIIEIDAHEVGKGDIKLRMTVPQAMTLYALTRRDAALKHLTEGGVVIRDTKVGKELLSQNTPVHLTGDWVSQLNDALEKVDGGRPKVVAQRMSEFMSTIGSAWGNKVSMERYGKNSMGEKFYWPMQTSDAKRATVSLDDDMTQNLYGLANSGFTKPLDRRANNALVLDDAFNVFSDHMVNMAKYNAMVLPMLDVMKWYNWNRTQTDIVNGEEVKTPVALKNAVRDAYGNPAEAYFRQFMADLNNPKKEGGLGYEQGLGKLVGSYKAAAVGFNARVALLQPTAFFRAGMVIGPNWLAKGAAMKGGLEEMEKYSGIYQWKDLGFYDTDVGRSVRRIVRGEDSRLKQAKADVVEFSMKAAEWGDKITWAAIWNACKLEQSSQHKGVSYEELMQLTEARFNEVVFSTQVFDSTLSRSQVMRNQQLVYKMLTAFMSEPTLSFNMVMDKFLKYQIDSQKIGKGNAWKKNGGLITRALAVYTVTNIAAAIAESLMDAVRDDDDDPFIEKFLEHMFGDWSEVKDIGSFMKALYTGNFMSDMTVLGKIPFAKDLISLAQGYEIGGRMDTQAIQNAIGVYKIWHEKFNLMTGRLDKATRDTWYGNMTTYGAIYKTMQVMSQLSGIPGSNLMRDAVAIGYNPTIGKITGKPLESYESARKREMREKIKSEQATDEEYDVAVKYDLSKDFLDKYYDHEYKNLKSTPKDAGIPLDVFAEFSENRKEAGARNMEDTGKVINAMGIPSEMKDKLFLCYFSEKNLAKMPWHEGE